MEIVTRAEAQSQGLVHYFSGSQCKHGHTSLRYTSNGCCLECEQLKDKSKAQRDWYLRNRESLIVKKAIYRASTKVEAALRDKKYRENHRAEHRANGAKRRAAKLQAIPPWVDSEAIKQFYLRCPEGCHVDHVVPLIHPEICGLHVIENLQYLTAEQNLKKGNSWPYYDAPELSLPQVEVISS